jgi:hypothetical protein
MKMIHLVGQQPIPILMAARLVRTRFPGQSKSVHSLLELFWC